MEALQDEQSRLPQHMTWGVDRARLCPHGQQRGGTARAKAH